MSEELEQIEQKGPNVDFSFQLNLARDKAEKKIFTYLCEIAQKVHNDKKRLGILVVLGIFGSANTSSVDGMRKLSNEKLDTYININFNQFKDEVVSVFESGNDGAIIINQDGQLLAEKVYLMVDRPEVEIPEGAGTRHISAASFSSRKDVLATFTLSEESSFVRIWKNGIYTEQFHPDQKGDE